MRAARGMGRRALADVHDHGGPLAGDLGEDGVRMSPVAHRDDVGDRTAIAGRARGPT